MQIGQMEVRIEGPTRTRISVDRRDFGKLRQSRQFPRNRRVLKPPALCTAQDLGLNRVIVHCGQFYRSPHTETDPLAGRRSGTARSEWDKVNLRLLEVSVPRVTDSESGLDILAIGDAQGLRRIKE